MARVRLTITRKCRETVLVVVTQLVPHGQDLEAHVDTHVAVAVQDLVTFLEAKLFQLEARLRQEVHAQQQVATPQLTKNKSVLINNKNLVRQLF